MAIYYVDNSKSSSKDTNAGTATSPWSTIQHAADVAKAGDTVYVKAGNYKPFEVMSSGTASNPIVFSAYPGQEHEVIIDGTGTKVRGLVEVDGKSYVTINGFRLQDAPTDGIYVQGSKAGTHNVVISNNDVENTGNSGIYAAGLVMGQTIGVNEYRLFDITITNNEVTRTNLAGANEAITLGGGVDGFVVSGNWVHDSKQFGIDVKVGARNGEIYDNTINGIEKHGIYLDSNSRTIENVKIYSNTLYDNTNGIVLAREIVKTPKTPVISNIDIYDNLVYDNTRSGIIAYKHTWDTGIGKFSDVVISSNTVYDNGNYGIQLAGIKGFATNFAINSNTVFGHKKGIDNQIGAKESGNTVSAGVLKVAPGDGASAFTSVSTDASAGGSKGFEAHYTVGDKAYTTSAGVKFESAPGISDGEIALRNKTVAISGTTDDPLYDSYGFGEDFEFAIKVPEKGTYRVDLHLAELFHDKAGQRVFDVALEGKIPSAFNDIDIFKLAQGHDKAVTVSAQVTVNDGILNIDASHVIDNALINAFSIELL